MEEIKRCKNCTYEQDYLNVEGMCQTCGNAKYDGYMEALDVLLYVIQEMQEKGDFDNFTLEELKQRII